MVILKLASFEEAIKLKEWINATEEKIQMIEKNHTWLLVDRPSNKNIIKPRWIYKTKMNIDDTINKLKARLVAKGYPQLPGVDFSETFAPVAKLDTIRLLLALAA
ncbi:uncharacterized protein LOC111290667 [Durio zibethinus]|uniref:Uncharacterized protein LOC111290667 n=1 Tax=Durio zibethinus TaxID=66656 RepID=A0A6P5YBF5_DURZI|nr:uncharacterized protein LOC111290667 [Durio zibethinus]